MSARADNVKPYLFLCGGFWHCYAKGIIGRADTMNAAYLEWVRRLR